jgi:hypothetical protein
MMPGSVVDGADTPVIDTVRIKVGPFAATDLHASVEQLGTPHGPALNVVERCLSLEHHAAKAIEEYNQSAANPQPNPRRLYRHGVSPAIFSRSA